MSISSGINDMKGTEVEVKPKLLFSLLLACSLFIFVLPIIPFLSSWWIKVLMFTIIIVLAVSAVSSSYKLKILAFLVILFEWITNLTDLVYLHYLAELTTNIFIIWVVGKFVLQIMNRSKVTLYTLVEALLGYLLLGIMFTGLVAFVDSYMTDAFSKVLVTNFDRAYYALITLTTTGYGDITPISSVAKSLSLVIAISGQFYVAVIVAIIVGKYSSALSS